MDNDSNKEKFSEKFKKELRELLWQNLSHDRKFSSRHKLGRRRTYINHMPKIKESYDK